MFLLVKSSDELDMSFQNGENIKMPRICDEKRNIL
jgi:hypothetical protein